MAKESNNAQHIAEEPKFLPGSSKLSGCLAYLVKNTNCDLHVPATVQEHLCSKECRVVWDDRGTDKNDTEEPAATFERYISSVDASDEVGKNKYCTTPQERREKKATRDKEEVQCGDYITYCKIPSAHDYHSSSCCSKWQDIIMLLEKEISLLRGQLINSDSKVKELENLVASYKNTCCRIQQNLSLVSNKETFNADPPKGVKKEVEIDKLKNDALSYQLLAQLCQAEYSESMKDTEKYKQQVQDLSQQLKDANLTIKEQEKQLNQLADFSTVYKPRRIELPPTETSTRRVRSLPSSPHSTESAWYPLAPPPRPVVSRYCQPQSSAQGPPEHRYVEPEELLSMSDVISRSRNSSSSSHSKRMVLRSSVSRSLSDSSRR